MSTSALKEPAPIKIAPGAVVCVESKLKGNITIGSMTVVHPKASIVADAGPIILGENNIVEEQASIIYTSEEDISKENQVPLSIGINNIFEVGCEIRAKSIGDHNVFESKCYVGPDVEIGNGCIIGAGCQVTVAEKLPDQTVITGKHCVRSVAFDKPPGSDDLTRQDDELTVMSEIFTKEEFSSQTCNSHLFVVFQAHIPLPSDFMLLLSKDAARTQFPINHLPPIRLVASLPQDYPSQSMPNFNLSCCWLSRSKLDSLVFELEKLWNENKSEIIFTWCSFLKDESLNILNIYNKYDLNERCGDVEKYTQVYKNKQINDSLTPSITSDVANATSNRGKDNNKYHYARKQKTLPPKKLGDENSYLLVKAKEKLVKQGVEKMLTYTRDSLKDLYFSLIEFNASKTRAEFSRTLQNCNVCFCPVLGELCKQLNCGHITCVECLKRMCEVHIKHATMESIICSEEGCGLEIPVNIIQELVSKDLFDQFDRLMLNRTLDKISNMTYCPRVHCQYPVSTQGEENLAVCPNCAHAFCIFCKRAYHGIEGCRLKVEEKRELIEEYMHGSHEVKVELEKRYGKKQLTELVTALQSEQWMSENSKKCPTCNINIEKNDGCNKMICRKCNTNFCWMCLTRVSSLNPYLHYQDPKSRCFNLLFQGTYHDQEDLIEEIPEEEEEVEDD